MTFLSTAVLFALFVLCLTSCSGLISFRICIFGLEIKYICGTTVKSTKGNRVEKGFNLTNTRERGERSERGRRRLRMAQGSLLIHPRDGPSSRLQSIPSSHWDSNFLFPLPPRAWSSTTAGMVSSSRTRTRVLLLVVVVALRLAAITYDEGVSKRNFHFSSYPRSSPKQVFFPPPRVWL